MRRMTFHNLIIRIKLLIYSCFFTLASGPFFGEYYNLSKWSIFWGVLHLRELNPKGS